MRRALAAARARLWLPRPRRFTLAGQRRHSPGRKYATLPRPITARKSGCRCLLAGWQAVRTSSPRSRWRILDMAASSSAGDAVQRSYRVDVPTKASNNRVQRITKRISEVRIVELPRILSLFTCVRETDQTGPWRASSNREGAQQLPDVKRKQRDVRKCAGADRNRCRPRACGTERRKPASWVILASGPVSRNDGRLRVGASGRVALSTQVQPHDWTGLRG
jgi:hypothetical protein